MKKVRQEKGYRKRLLENMWDWAKIESGKTNISIDDASVLLEAMGEKN